jgi:hypothetical protein
MTDDIASGKSLRGTWVELRGDAASPPLFAARMALTMARLGPCRKSRRGAAVYRSVPEVGVLGARHYAIPVKNASAGAGAGFNGPPMTLAIGGARPAWATCDGSEACRRDCGRRCVHAEVRAVMALLEEDRAMAPHLHMVHVKIPAHGEEMPPRPDGLSDHAGLPSGGPSCIDCSKFLLDACFGGIWLYESRGWRYYTAAAFHHATVASTGVHG